MRVLVCGSREWTSSQHRDIVFTFLDTFNKKYPVTKIIEGECRGPDLWSKEWAQKESIGVVAFRPHWEKQGKKAGPERNLRMIKEGNPDYVLAFTDNIEASKGTKNMVMLARKEGIPVYVYGYGYGLV